MVNGIEYNGNILYGVDEELLESDIEYCVDGVMNSNLTWYDNEWEENYIFLGDSDMEFFVYAPHDNSYLVIDKEGSAEIFESFKSCVELILYVINQMIN